MKLLLRVPEGDRDDAYEEHAIYDEALRCWYIDDQNISGEGYPSDWLQVEDANVYCENLYLFSLVRKCWRCGKETPCVCLATDKCYSAEKAFTLDTNVQLFSHVKDVSVKLKRYLAEKYKYYLDYTKQTKDYYIANHCFHCNAVQGDYYLHDLPETSFYRCLCYSEGTHPDYRKITNHYLVPLSGHFPDYDVVAHSYEFMMLHMQTEVENWASLGIDQKCVNRIFSMCERKADLIL